MTYPPCYAPHPLRPKVSIMPVARVSCILQGNPSKHAFVHTRTPLRKSSNSMCVSRPPFPTSPPLPKPTTIIWLEKHHTRASTVHYRTVPPLTRLPTTVRQTGPLHRVARRDPVTENRTSFVRRSCLERRGQRQLLGGRSAHLCCRSFRCTTERNTTKPETPRCNSRRFRDCGLVIVDPFGALKLGTWEWECSLGEVGCPGRHDGQGWTRFAGSPSRRLDVERGKRDEGGSGGNELS